MTGGAGLVGSRITARLRELGAHPVCLCAMNAYPEQVYADLFGVHADDPGVVLGDVRDAALVRKLVADAATSSMPPPWRTSPRARASR
ncbi:hypothetical protein [Streptomyces sp. NPDC002054]|uniref:hypothetical protein n=1 Tax=Streptomyces sp. NPDC002054 TaxID=3154663 RepID=UPI0033240862